MNLESMGRPVAKAPAAFVVFILLLTAVFGYFAAQTNFDSEEEDFNPDSEAAQASQRINDYFGPGVRTVQVIARDRAGEDVLVRDQLLEVLDLEGAILQPGEGGPDITDTLESTASVPTGVQSIADIIAFGAMSLQGAQMFGVEMQNTSSALGTMNENLTVVGGTISTIDYDDNESVGSTLYITNMTLGLMVQYILSMTPEEPPANGNGGMPGIDDIRAIIEAMDDATVKGTITGMNTFDPAPLNAAVEAVVQQRTLVEENVAVSQESPIGGPLTAMLMDPGFMNGSYTFMGQPVNHSTLIDDSLKSLYTIDAAMGMITGFEAQPEVLANTARGLAHGLEFVLSKDYDATVPAPKAKASLMIVQQNGSMDRERILESQYELEDVAKEIEASGGGDIEFGVVAGEILFDKINTSSMESLGTLLGLAIFFIILILALVFRSLTDTALTLIALLMTIVWTFGLGVILGFTFNPMTIAVPILLVGLAVDYGIHLTIRYRIEKRTQPLDRATIITIGSVGMALLLATITTVFSFSSNVLSDLAMMRQFGFLAASGIISAFIVMNTFVPASRLLIDQRRERKGLRRGSRTGKGNGPKRPGALIRFVQTGATAGARYGTTIAVVAVMLSGVSFYSLTGIDTEFDFMDFLPDELDETQTITFLFDNFNFTSSSSTVLMEGTVVTTSVFQAIYQSEDNMAAARDVVKVGDRADTRSPMSVVLKFCIVTSPSYVPELGVVYESTVPDTNGVPTRDVDVLVDALAAHPLSSGDITGVLHLNEEGEYDAAIISVSVRDAEDGGEKLTEDMSNAISPLSDLKDGGELDEAIVTDGPVLTYLTVTAMNEAGLQSVMATVIMALFLLMGTYFAFYRTVVVGMLSTIPIVLVIGWVFGSMYLLAIPLNVVTIMISALTIGLGITYAIHISHRFLELVQEKPWKDALCDTVGHTGAALFGAAITTIGGFGILTFSILPPLAQFGIVTALSIFYSFMASVFVLPSFLAIWAGWKYGKEGGDTCKTGEEAPSGIAPGEGPETTAVPPEDGAPEPPDRPAGPVETPVAED